MTLLNHEVAVFEKKIPGFNRRSLGLEDLRNLCRTLGLVLMVEPFPCQGLHMRIRGVPVITVNRRLDHNSMLFTGFWAVFLNRLRPGGVRVLNRELDWNDRVLLVSAVLASMALVPNSLLRESLAVHNGSGLFSSLIRRLVNSRISRLLSEEPGHPAIQAL